MSGIIVGIVALPLAIAFGIASGVSPEKGLITAIIGGFIVSFLGGNSVQIGGPTGALFGILLAFGWLFPEAKMGILFVPVMIPARIFVAIYAAFELFFGVTGFAFDNVAHFAHLGGMLFGAGVLWMWKRQGKLY